LSQTEREFLEHLVRRRETAQAVTRRVLAAYQSAFSRCKDHCEFLNRPVKREDSWGDIIVVPITDGDMLRAVARLHFEAFAGYLNTYLGMRYVSSLLQWFLYADGAIAIAAFDSKQENVVGYAIGAPAGYRRALNRALFWVVVIQILIRPSVLGDARFWNKARAQLKSLLMSPQAPHARLGLPEPVMSLVAIGVAPSARRKGVGLRLMQAFEAIAAELGIHSLLLSAYRNNTTARHFYENCGWEPNSGADGKSEGMWYYRLIDQKIKPFAPPSESQQ
jgi:ribosomal protein S18 acetylase RimI-like enzyme